MSKPVIPRSCPYSACRSRQPDAAGQAAIIRHSLLRTRQGTMPRWRCKTCGRTFTANHGTPYHRLRSSPARFDRAVHMSVQGVSQAAAASTEGVSQSTIRRWLERAARHTEAFFDALTVNVEPDELQADEVRGYTWDKESRQFVFAMIEVSSRLWLSRVVGNRTRRSCRLLMRDARKRCRMPAPRVLIVTDPFKFYAPEIRKTWGSTCVHVESGKIIRGNRVIRVHNHLVTGTESQLDEARARCQDSKKLNTAYIERLNLVIRRSLSCLHRKTESAAKNRTKLTEAIDRLRCYYNFIRPHGALKFGREIRTPAQQAGLVSKRLSFRDIFMAFRPMARVPWIRDERVRNAWIGRYACAGNNS